MTVKVGVGSASGGGNCCRWRRLLLALLFVWLLIFLLTVASLLSTSPSADSLTGGGALADTDLNQRVEEVSQQLIKLQHQNNQLRQQLVRIASAVSRDNSGGDAILQQLGRRLLSSNKCSGREPTAEYEQIRRQLLRDIDEMWRYMDSQLTEFSSGGGESGAVGGGDGRRASWSVAVRANLEQYHSTLVGDVVNLTAADGGQLWRDSEFKQLSQLLRNRLLRLQHPADCGKVRKLVCDLNKACGFGCQFHHVTYCLMMAYGSGRTLVLRSDKWRYDRAGWEHIFLPVSSNCTSDSGTSSASWPGTATTQVVRVPIVDVLRPRPALLPLAVPSDLADRLTRISGDPAVWFIGQLVQFLFRLQPEAAAALHAFQAKLAMPQPCVGVQVRRTDKVGSEAAFHPLSEYMKHVDKFYTELTALRGRTVKRCVYVASDDPSVYQEAVSNYPEYRVLGDPDVAKTAALRSRYTATSLLGVIQDIYALSLTEHLVCTFSSQVCRLAYELMQSRHVDAWRRFTSLDDVYYFGGQWGHEQRARFAHVPATNAEISLQPGDIVGIAGNHWNGYSKGENKRTGEVGLYPAYKAVDILRQAPGFVDNTSRATT